MTKCEKLQNLINKLADGPVKAELQQWHDEHCGGGATTQDTGDNGPGPK